MTSSMLVGEKRWNSGRRGVMTVLGKVAAPKPLNLPSQRLENHGIDPNVEIVPKGTHTWGNKSSTVVNAWSSSSGSLNTNVGASPNYLNCRPSSGGSSSRSSTAGSDRILDLGANVKGLNSRPSSASGSLTSSQTPVTTSHRPHSADTRTGSSQLSRFAESPSGRSSAWSGVGTAQKLDVVTSTTNEFTLACGDFPTLGSEKHDFEKGRLSQVDIATRVEVNTEHVVDDGKETAGTTEDSAEQNGMGFIDYSCRQTNSAVPPQHVECWRGPAMGVPPAAIWFRGPQGFPYGAPYPPGTFRPEQFPYYAPQAPIVASSSQSVHPSTPGARGPNGESYRPPHMPGPRGPNGESYGPPHMPGPRGPNGESYGPPHMPGPRGPNGESYGHMPGPRGPNGDSYGHMPGPRGPNGESYGHMSGPRGPNGESYRPAHMPGPRGPNGEPYRSPPHIPDAFMPHVIAARPGYGPPDGYYAPQMSFYGPNGYNVPCMRPYGGPWHPGTNVPCNQGETYDNRSTTSWGDDHAEEGKEEEKESHETFASRGNSVGPGVKLLKATRETREANSASENFQESPVSSKNSALMQQIECLNAKARASEATCDPSENDSEKGKKNDLSAKDGQSHDNIQDGVTSNINKKAKPSSRPAANRGDYERPQIRSGSKKVNTQEAKRNNFHLLDSSYPDNASNSMTSRPHMRDHHTCVESTEKTEMGVEGKDEEVVIQDIDASDSQAQRVLMRELAKRRAKQRQEEEEQREKEQRAKALAKLEELDRRMQAGESSKTKPEISTLDNAGHRKVQESEPSSVPASTFDTTSSAATSVSEGYAGQQRDMAADVVTGTDDVSSKHVPLKEGSGLPTRASEGAAVIKSSQGERTKDRHPQRLQRNMQSGRPRDKGRNADTVIWAPKSRESPAESIPVPEKPDGKSKKGEIERYVPKSVARNAPDNPTKPDLPPPIIEFGSFNAQNIPFLAPAPEGVDSKRENKKKSKKSNLPPSEDNNHQPEKTEQQNDSKSDPSGPMKEKRDQVKGQKRHYKHNGARPSQVSLSQPGQDGRGVVEKPGSHWKPKVQPAHYNSGDINENHTLEPDPNQPTVGKNEKSSSGQDVPRGKNMPRETRETRELDTSGNGEVQRNHGPSSSNVRKNGPQNRRFNRRQESREEWIADGHHGQNSHMEYQPIRRESRFGAAGGAKGGEWEGGVY